MPTPGTSNEIINIPVGKIHVASVYSKYRNFSSKLCEMLKPSMELEGMHHPIIVRPHKDKPGDYELCCGRHRLYTAKDLLGWETISAKVKTNWTDEDLEMALHSENLMRAPLTDAKKTIAIKRWWKIYSAKYPKAADSKSLATEKARAKKKAKHEPKEEEVHEPEVQESEEDEGEDESPQASQPESEPTLKDNIEPEAVAVKVFSQEVADAHGITARHARRKIQVATAFTEDELEALSQMDISETDQLRISKIKDNRKRSEIVSLISSGMDVEEAIKQVIVADPGSINDEALAPFVEPTFTDDEWVAKFCADVLAKLGPAQKKVYTFDAVYYRQSSEIRRKFARASRKIVNELASRYNVDKGRCVILAETLSLLAHPMEWPVCGTCQGKGVTADGKVCPSCFGKGYSIKTERPSKPTKTTKSKE